MVVRSSSETPEIRGEARLERIGERLIAKLPDEASSALPSRGQVAVRAEIEGESFVIVLEPDGRKGHWLPINDPLRDTLRAGHGDRVNFAMQVAVPWPEPRLPEDVAEAFDAAPDIADAWADITTQARWEWVRWINATKVPATRQRRIEVTIDKLRHGSRRPCCFDLSSCTDPEVSKSGKLIEVD